MALSAILAILPAHGFAEALPPALLEKTTWTFSDAPVDEADLTAILQAGLNADSAMNEQPWMFHVITDPEIIAALGGVQAPVMILVSVTDSNPMKLFDAGLACQSMQIAARSMGYGSKIETSPSRMVRNDATDQWAELLGIPSGKMAAAAVYIGHGAEDAVVKAVFRYDGKPAVQLRAFGARKGITKEQAIRGQVLDDMADVDDVMTCFTVGSDKPVDAGNQPFRVIREAPLSFFVQVIVLHVDDEQSILHRIASLRGIPVSSA